MTDKKKNIREGKDFPQGYRSYMAPWKAEESKRKFYRSLACDDI